MGDKKYLLIILSLFFVNFLNLNATILLKDNSRQLFPQKAIVELNFTYKYIDNENFIEIYDEDGKLIYTDKSYILEPEVKASTMKVKIIERESDGKKIPIVEKYYLSGKLYSITMYELKDKDKDIEKNDIKKFYTSGKLEKDIYIYIYSEICYESGNLKIRMMKRKNKLKVETYNKNGEI
ncbi:hypothetical protein NCTC15132_06145 [Fusobacterium sp. oral taxon C10]